MGRPKPGLAASVHPCWSALLRVGVACSLQLLSWQLAWQLMQKYTLIVGCTTIADNFLALALEPKLHLPNTDYQPQEGERPPQLGLSTKVGAQAGLSWRVGSSSAIRIKAGYSTGAFSPIKPPTAGPFMLHPPTMVSYLEVRTLAAVYSCALVGHVCALHCGTVRFPRRHCQLNCKPSPRLKVCYPSSHGESG